MIMNLQMKKYAHKNKIQVIFATDTPLNFLSVAITCEYIHFVRHFWIMGVLVWDSNV